VGGRAACTTRARLTIGRSGQTLPKQQKWVLGWCGVWSMNFSQMKDARILAFYEYVRRQVEIDKQAGGRYRFAGDGVKKYAEKLREELDARQLRYSPIDWS
jgi:hypothetical protein